MTKGTYLYFIVVFLGILISEQAKSQLKDKIIKKPVIKVNFNIKYSKFDHNILMFRAHKNESSKNYKFVNSLKEVNLINQIDDYQVSLYAGDRVDLALVLQNQTDEALYFFLGHHTFDPVLNSVGFTVILPTSSTLIRLPPKKIGVFYSYLVVKGLKEDRVMAIDIPLIGLTELEVKRITNINPESEVDQ